MRGLVAALAFLLGVTAAKAEGDCPALPRRDVMPLEATPQAIPQALWQSQVHALDAALPNQQRESLRLVFIGDSITAGWDPGLFDQFYGTRAPLLMGVIGDYTQGVLERLPGEWGMLRPRLAVLLIGTNNTLWGGSSAANVALGIAEIVRLIHQKSSGTRVLILGILPHGATVSDPARAVDAQINTLIAGCADGQSVFYAQPGSALLDRAGRLSTQVSFDGTHLTAVGYALLAMALEPDIRRIMGE